MDYGRVLCTNSAVFLHILSFVEKKCRLWESAFVWKGSLVQFLCKIFTICRKLYNERGNNMKMRKFFKKLMTVALAAALLSVGAGVEKAEAANCKHGAYYDYRTYVEGGGYSHQVPLYVYKYDEYGNEYYVPDGYACCIITNQKEYWDVICGYCKQTIRSYTYYTPLMHSICPVG